MKLRPLTLDPTSSPTATVSPTEVPPLGVLACQCNAKNECVDDVIQTFNARVVKLSLKSTPPGSEIVRIDSLSFEMRENKDSPPQFVQRVVLVTSFVSLILGSQHN